MNVHVGRDRDVGDFRAWGFEAWDFDTFHREELPRRLTSGVSDQVAWDLNGAPPIGITLDDGRGYSYSVADGKVQIEPGVRDDAVCVLEFTESSWQNYVNEFRTSAGLVLAEQVHFKRGDLGAWQVWDPAIRCMYSGRPVYNPDEPLLDAKGAPLDLHRRFTMEDDFEEMSHFLRTAGFIHIAGAMKHRLNEISDEINRVRDRSHEGEIHSWWTHNEKTGEAFPYRLLYISEISPLVHSLMDEDPTVKKLVPLAKRDLVPLHDRGQGAMAVLKPFSPDDQIAPAMAENIDWHTDCGLGGCNIMCPSINIGIHLDACGPESSQLHILAGSNGRAPHHINTLDVPNAVALRTEPGDISIHYSCTLHAGPPPVGNAGRRTLYLPFYAPETLELLGPYQSFEQIQPGYGSGRSLSYEQIAESLATH